MSTQPHVTLFSADLLSKWGFNDGDEPDQWMNYCDNLGIAWEKLEYPLVALVKKYLIPALEQDVTVCEIETCHNPIRVETVNSVDVTELWRTSAQHAPSLSPEFVNVPMADVLRLALQEAGLTTPPRSEGVRL
ncbi:hypothetical protein ABZ508_02635 [Streptomyces lavendulocolor]|uniref:Uncharacterized protein n=1 Tax=Streptomyces lavendulocolor TaxID=67316 RepID=A0ABV2VYA2_9ACTN